ncbi:MAG TPA: archease [Bryobacterales bacterium]|nr:archease [Bryobacterales bacterium]
MFEILEHTADIGFRARGRTAAELFETAAQAMASIALELDAVAERAEYPLHAQGADCEALLVNWLSEVLYWMDGKQLALRRFRVDAITATEVSGAAMGEPRDPARHRARLIVKGVTYHQLKVVETPEGWCAEVYLDI